MPSQHQARGDFHERPLLHFLAGARSTDLARILWSHGGISRKHLPQAMVLAAATIARAPACMVEAMRVARRVRTFSFDPAPVFIVGHWRSGTTYLHNLMSRDPAFCFPTITDVLRPYDFYPSPIEPISRWVLLRLLPPTRPMDDVPLEPHLPQEEEIATATMGAPSFFNCLFFPKRLSEVFAAEVLFDGISPERLSSWNDCLRYFLAKLAALHPERRLLLKNPAHSARIPHLRALFPGAKFIHIHRHPIHVFQSTRKLYRSLLPLLALQDYEHEAIDEHIVWAYPQLMKRLLDSLEQLPRTDVATVSYDALLADPMATVARIYRELDLGDPRSAPQTMPSDAGNTPRSSRIFDVDEGTLSRLASLWRPLLDRLGYSLPEPMERSL